MEGTFLYLTGRMLFSLSRSGFAPKVFGRVTSQGSPRNAVFASTIGLFIGAVLSVLMPNSAYMALFGISIFGGIFVWIMVLITLLYFRKKRAEKGLPLGKLKMPFYPYLAYIGIAALTAILIDCFFIDLKIAWYAGVPWLIAITLAYYVYKKRKEKSIKEGLSA